MTRLMVDSITPSLVPAKLRTPIGTLNVDLEAGYINGAYAWYSRAPDAWIDVFGTRPDADILDVETGDATPATAVTWVKQRLALKPSYLPIIYCNRGNITPIFNEMNASGLYVGRHFRTWIATLDGTQVVHDMTGVTAVQVWGEAQLGLNVDASLVYDDSWKAGNVTTDPTMHSWVVDGSLSLNQEAARFGVWRGFIIWWTVHYGGYQSAFMQYVVNGNWDAKLPKGITIYVRF